MKMQTLFAAAFMMMAMFCTTLQAQDGTSLSGATSTLSSSDSETADFINAYVDAFNKKDRKAFRKLWHSDAKRKSIDGTVATGVDNVMKHYDTVFENHDRLELRIREENTSTTADGSLVNSGTYLVRGTLKEDGTRVEYRGSYRNVLKRGTEGLVVSEMTIMEQL